ncbi:lipase family protein [Sorangium sp. So ce1000]|uniref:lipase family protein n=1 Tax=Sorangium sp. So ce1000 TaxID=3133325 RepID=UPI003F621737
MEFEAIRVTRIHEDDACAEDAESAARSLTMENELEHVDNVDYMIKAPAGEHDRRLASIFGIASVWSYSDTDTVAKVMHKHAGITWNETVRLKVANPVFLTDTTAYLVQSEDRKLCILCFPGAELENAIQWFMSANCRPEPFLSAGHVHGGFLRGVMMLATALKSLLQSARMGESICDAVARERAVWSDCASDYPPCNEGDQRPPGPDSVLSQGELRQPSEEGPDVLKALYITGHSLGGALAVIMAALLLGDPQLADFREKLRGVYTYGQPMVGYQDFKDRFERDLGKLLFRHVYRNDSIPRLPARTMGRFVHFGSLYTSEEGVGWVPSRGSTTQACTYLCNMSKGVLSWLLQEMLFDRTIIHRLLLRNSYPDHLPIHYLRTSEAAFIGTTFT